ncbi:MAG: hypothetical protein FJ253_00270 [Phycisphaerae bacterium]|nr:hypothetical protein [Phycisphaerae bacterium]
MNPPASSNARNAPSTGADSAVNDVARVRVESAADTQVILSVPNTNYRLHLAPGAPLSAFPSEPGRRAKGVISGKALRMHRAVAGGSFIEPIEGHPRIVQGSVLAVDLDRNRVLIHAAVPMWLAAADGQLASDFQTGDMVNFYAESGMRFTPR